jgi:uncharacterized protein involved in exopolysaccharide biosynthesis
LKKEYEKFEINSDDYLVAFSDVPELGMQLSKLLRTVKIKNEVFLLLQQQYYKEKIQENRDVPTVDILDEAIAPQKKSAPTTIYTTFVSSVFIFLLISTFLVFREKKISFFKKENRDQ